MVERRCQNIDTLEEIADFLEVDVFELLKKKMIEKKENNYVLFC